MSALEEIFTYSLHFILPPLLLVFGSFGNIIGVVLLLQRKKLAILGTRKMYIYLFVVDTVYLLNLLIDYLENGFHLQLNAYSQLTCRLHLFFTYSLANVSPMILVYIAIERLIEIKYPMRRFMLQKNKSQLIYLFLIIGFNIIYYVPFVILIIQSEFDEQKRYCHFGEQLQIDSILSFMDLFNRVLMPFILMTISSILLVLSIFRSRKRVYRNYTTMENRVFKKDLRLAFTSLILNLCYIAFNLPISISELMNLSDFYYVFSLYMFYASYALNFYVVLFSNFIFREEFLLFLNFKNNLQSYYVVRYTTTVKNSKETIELVSFIE